MCLCSFVVQEARRYIAPFVLDQEQSSSVLKDQRENVLAAQRSIVLWMLLRRNGECRIGESGTQRIHLIVGGFKCGAC